MSGSGSRVQEFNGTTLAWMQTPIKAGNGNNADGALYQPEAKADSLSNIWLVDALNSRVQKFSPSGSWLMTIGGGTVAAPAHQLQQTRAIAPGTHELLLANGRRCTCAQSAANGSFRGGTVGNSVVCRLLHRTKPQPHARRPTPRCAAKTDSRSAKSMRKSRRSPRRGVLTRNRNQRDFAGCDVELIDPWS